MSGVGSRALVLGSGGITGIAWELGVLAGLAERGVDLGTADLVVGTSAGAVVGASAEYTARYRLELAERVAEPRTRMRPYPLARFLLVMVTTSDPRAFRRKAGRLALAARVEGEAERRRTVASWLPDGERWPPAALSATSRVVLVRPDPDARAAMGRSITDKLDPSRRKAAALAGFAQAAAEAERVSEVWHPRA
ncbi:hypothetical protein CFN78_14365 [Amycolatopsis antarctica]|uniref:Uncharacterized protein n=1 Tax=Amycolatopsis antarctica TaxID=1854586 RepID=A0A263D2V2_9PSEU|nr:patatin-like phospholipase family protein [Amycolatopsis antarctica]OZM72793.1 hypothetical protein CFN78_14365 [Amycolatopsis antarctica]